MSSVIQHQKYLGWLSVLLESVATKAAVVRAFSILWLPPAKLVVGHVDEPGGLVIDLPPGAILIPAQSISLPYLQSS